MLTIQPQRVHFDLIQTSQHGILEIDGPSLEEIVPLGFKFTHTFTEANACLQLCKELPLDKGLLLRNQPQESYKFHVEAPNYDIDILGIDENATPAEIRTAHRKLMGKMHPDKDGTDYLAALINEARDYLIARHQDK